jgi:tetratricopeptide (TPR) repeat protein
MTHRWYAALAAAVVATAACGPPRPITRQECYSPDRQLADVLQPFEARRAAGCGSSERRGAACEQYRREIERLSAVCPAHVPTLMANAVISYDDGQREKAQQFLDRSLGQPGSHPDAAALRARIAIEEGNAPFARRLLEQQIRLAPNHAGLRETNGGALFLAGQLDGARRELAAAATLGAPAWRVAYHLGLIEEAAGRVAEARRYYAEAIAGNPGWATAQARLDGLRAIESLAPQP